jgi:hypothetical protein
MAIDQRVGALMTMRHNVDRDFVFAAVATSVLCRSARFSRRAFGILRGPCRPAQDDYRASSARTGTVRP